MRSRKWSSHENMKFPLIIMSYKDRPTKKTGESVRDAKCVLPFLDTVIFFLLSEIPAGKVAYFCFNTSPLFSCSSLLTPFLFKLLDFILGFRVPFAPPFCSFRMNIEDAFWAAVVSELATTPSRVTVFIVSVVLFQFIKRGILYTPNYNTVTPPYGSITPLLVNPVRLD